MTNEMFRLIAEEREREVRELIRVRTLLPSGPRRPTAQPPRRLPGARER